MQNTLDKINKNLEYCKEEYLKGCVRIGASRNNQLRNNQLRTSSILDGFMYDIKNMNDIELIEVGQDAMMSAETIKATIYDFINDMKTRRIV